MNTIRTSLNSAAKTIISALAIIATCFMLAGCGDEGGYELRPGTAPGAPKTCSDPNLGFVCKLTNGAAGKWGCDTATGALICVADTGSLTPPQDNPPDPPGGCKAVPSSWDMRSFEGCMSQPDLSGIYRTATRLEFSFEGKPFQEDASGRIGELYYLVNPESKDCGPVKTALVSNSGSIEVRITGGEVDFYLIDSAHAQLIWAKLHGGNPPSYAETISPAFSSLLIDIFECEEENPSCTLKNKISSSWPGGDLVRYQHSGPTAMTDGAFCGWMFVVMKSR